MWIYMHILFYSHASPYSLKKQLKNTVGFMQSMKKLMQLRKMTHGIVCICQKARLVLDSNCSIKQSLIIKVKWKSTNPNQLQKGFLRNLVLITKNPCSYSKVRHNKSKFGYCSPKQVARISNGCQKLPFLNGILEDEVYVNQPPMFEIRIQEHKVYKLKKAMYGLKQLSELGIVALICTCSITGSTKRK